MPAAPPVTVKFSRKAPTLIVRLGPIDGSAPTARDQVDFLQVSKVERAIGGSRLSAVTLKYDLGRTGEKIVDTLCPKGITRQVEVRELDDKGDPLRLLLWGKLAAQPISIDGQTQSLEYEVRIDKHLLGNPLTRTPFWNPNTSAVVDVDRPMIFNPEIDETVRGNCSDKTDAARDNAFLFYDVAGPNTAAARTKHGQTFTKWRICEAAHLLCWLLNKDQTFVQNPNLTELETALGDLDNFGVNVGRLKNRFMKPGKYLSELLDELLTPFGASWYVSLDLDPAGGSIRRLKFFMRNKGPKKELFLQRSGTLDPAKSSLTKLGLKFDIVNLANRIVVHSSRRQLEITKECVKGWPVSEDSLGLTELKKGSAGAKAHPHAGRYWPMNESGAHTGLRPEITAYTDLSTYLGTGTLPIARKLLPCISRFPDTNSDKLESRGYYVEYSVDGGTTWLPIQGVCSASRLEQEAGVWLENVPKEMWDVMATPDMVKLRVTATLEADTCLQAIAERVTESPNQDNVTLVMKLPDKFHSRSVDGSSVFFAEVASADEVNDLSNMQSYAEHVRSVEDAAELSLSAEIEGIDHPEYELGNLITRVNGLNISLVRSTPQPGQDGQYPQVVGITLDVATQRTTLLLETFDLEQFTND